MPLALNGSCKSSRPQSFGGSTAAPRMLPEGFGRKSTHLDSPHPLCLFSSYCQLAIRTMKRAAPVSDPGVERYTSRRRQEPVSCAVCRKKKLKCSRTFPCSNCVSRGLRCEPPDAPQWSQDRERYGDNSNFTRLCR